MSSYPSTSIRDNNGDVIGVGIEGNGNIIGKNIVIYQVQKEFNLLYLTKEYLNSHSKTNEDFNDWLEGFSLSLPSVYQEREYRRQDIISQIEKKLEEKGRILLLGESGTSKSILLMEIMCDYLKEDYKVLYNITNMELKNESNLIDALEGLLKSGNKVLVVVDDVHGPKTSNIFKVIGQLQGLDDELSQRLRFLLAARIPDFDKAIESNRFPDENIVKNIERFFKNGYKFPLKYFTKEEVKEFIQKYHEHLNPKIKNKSIEQNATDIFNDTEGHPIMVRFSVLNEGLTTHVKQMYRDYLLDKENGNMPHKGRIQIIILNSLFDISNIPLTDVNLEDLGLLPIANKYLKNAIIRKTGDIWKTIHPKWDMELIKHMFNLEYSLDDIEKAFIEIVDNMTKSQHVSGINILFLFNSIYHTIAKQKILKKDFIEKLINLVDVENRLDNFSKLLFYSTVTGLFYHDIGRYLEAMLEYDKAIEIKPDSMIAYYNKGVTLDRLKRYEDAIDCYDKAIEIKPDSMIAYYNKGVTLDRLKRYEDAIDCYDKAIEIKPDYAEVYYSKGLTLGSLERYEDAIDCYDKAIEIKPDYAEVYYSKGLTLGSLERYEDAIDCYDKAINHNRANPFSYDGKSYALFKLKKIDEAISCVNHAIELDNTYINALYNRSVYNANKCKIEESLSELKKALDLDVNHVYDPLNDKDFDIIKDDWRFIEIVKSYNQERN